MILTLQCAGERIAAFRFLCRGCVAAIGCAAALTELYEGRSLAQLAACDETDLLSAVGPLPAASRHALALVLETRDALLAAMAARR